MEILAEDLPMMREKLEKCKVIALDDMGKHPMMNPKYFNRKDKDILIKAVRQLMETPDAEIDTQFNSVCIDRLFSGSVDFSKLPVYVDNRKPSQQAKIDAEEPALAELKEAIKTNPLAEKADEPPL